MFEGRSLLDIIIMGGLTIYILIGCSILSLGIFIERYFVFRRNYSDRISFMSRVSTEYLRLLAEWPRP